MPFSQARVQAGEQAEAPTGEPLVAGLEPVETAYPGFPGLVLLQYQGLGFGLAGSVGLVHSWIQQQLAPLASKCLNFDHFEEL